MARRVPLLAAALALVVSACSSGGDVDVGGSGGDGGGGDTFVAAISGKPDQLDPHKTTAYPSFQVLENVYDTLVVPNPDDLTFEPALATEWETSDDQLTWTFTLRDDVTFHDGSDFDAADVVYSYNRIIDEELANAFRFATVKNVKAVDDTTVEITLTEPTPNLLSSVGGFKGMAILPEGGAKGTNLNQEAVGTGPFTLESVNAGDIQLKANPDYWGEGPNVGGVEFRFVSEATTALTGLRSGEIDWTDNVPPQQVSSLADDDEVELGRVPSVDYWYMSMNFEKKPFDDPKVRQAIAYAVDRQAVTEAAKFDAATVNQTAIPEDSSWYTDYAPYERDPQKAKQLLSDAGQQNLQMDLMVTDEYPETVQAAQVIESQLGEVGIKVNIQVEDFATWLDRSGNGNFEALFLGWLGNLDPFGYYHSQHTCDGSNNAHSYCDKETDRLLKQAANETDDDERQSLYDQAVKNIVDDVSYLYFYNPDVVQAWSPDVSGYTVRPDRAINFETVKTGS